MNRVNIQQSQPEAYKAMLGVEKYLAQSTLPNDFQELVRLRASLINQCHFCINMHSQAAKKLGVSDEKINALNTWQDSDLFSAAEKAALQLTDNVTNIASQRLPDDVYQAVANHFTEEEIAQLIVLVATINAWNRIGISMAGD